MQACDIAGWCILAALGAGYAGGIVAILWWMVIDTIRQQRALTRYIRWLNSMAPLYKEALRQSWKREINRKRAQTLATITRRDNQ